MIRKEIDVNQELTAEQIEMLLQVDRKPIVFDEDCPELSEEVLKRFKRISDERQADRRKQVVSLRLSSQAMRNAKALGKGYTSVLSRILENVLSDAELIEKYL